MGFSYIIFFLLTKGKLHFRKLYTATGPAAWLAAVGHGRVVGYWWRVVVAEWGGGTCDGELGVGVAI
jgi:hypothetical protein